MQVKALWASRPEKYPHRGYFFHARMGVSDTQNMYVRRTAV